MCTVYVAVALCRRPLEWLLLYRLTMCQCNIVNQILNRTQYCFTQSTTTFFKLPDPNHSNWSDTFKWKVDSPGEMNPISSNTFQPTDTVWRQFERPTIAVLECLACTRIECCLIKLLNEQFMQTSWNCKVPF